MSKLLLDLPINEGAKVIPFPKNKVRDFTADDLLAKANYPMLATIIYYDEKGNINFRSTEGMSWHLLIRAMSYVEHVGNEIQDRSQGGFSGPPKRTS